LSTIRLRTVLLLAQEVYDDLDHGIGDARPSSAKYNRIYAPPPLMEPAVVAAFALVIALEIAIPLALGYWIVKRFGLSWKVFALGAVFFIAVQVIHTPIVLLTQEPLYTFLRETLGSVSGALAAFALYLGFLAGLFEEVGRFLVYRYWFGRRGIALSRENGLLFGAGWGGIESVLVALLVLSALITYIAVTGDQMIFIPDDPAAQAQVDALRNLTPLDILPGLFERMMTITLHIAWSILVLASVVYGRAALLALAVLWHTAVDFAAVYIGQTAGILAAEASIFVFAVLGLVYLFWEWRRMGSRAPGA
jgi:uncharacterized membrane protein YhfC